MYARLKCCKQPLNHFFKMDFIYNIQTDLGNVTVQ